MSLGSGIIQTEGHCFEIRVYYEDTDVGGVVYHSNYLKFAERARTELLRCCGISQEELRRLSACVLIVTQLNIKYEKAARLDDVIQVRTNIADYSKVSLILDQSLWVDDKRIAQLRVHIAAIDSQAWSVTKLPENLMKKMMEILHG